MSDQKGWSPHSQVTRFEPGNRWTGIRHVAFQFCKFYIQYLIKLIHLSLYNDLHCLCPVPGLVLSSHLRL